jgi:hypothetical protein
MRIRADPAWLAGRVGLAGRPGRAAWQLPGKRQADAVAARNQGYGTHFPGLQITFTCLSLASSR